jgi:2'-hydroxyisoflavone reductase
LDHEPTRILIIGGTAFLGRAAVAEALARGHRVTTFNRGRTGVDVPGVEVVRGDRSEADDLPQLAGRRFDGVIDTCGFVPRVVGASALLLAPTVRQYVFVSSCSATTTWPGKPTPDGEDGQQCPSDAGPDDGDYGRLKAGCGRARSRRRSATPGPGWSPTGSAATPTAGSAPRAASAATA